ncbi:MAG TPA: hypothetical protein VEL76_00215, partial [Gemmataceae bacterium]|nr:hypothetical protein [Gemmataceae bacterium]
MLDYKFLTKRGALSEADTPTAPSDLSTRQIPAHILELIPQAVARENLVLPLDFDGETITFAAADADNIALADKLRFLLAKNVRLTAAPREALLRAIDRHYPRVPSIDLASRMEESGSRVVALDNEEADADEDDSEYEIPSPRKPKAKWWEILAQPARSLGKSITDFKRGTKGLEDGLDRGPASGGQGMFFYVVPEGQRVLRTRHDGRMDVIVGPKRVWRGRSTFQPMAHYVAHPGKFLVLRYRDGRQEHIAGPAEVWLDPRQHAQITVEDALQLSAKEAVVVYTSKDGGAVTRRIVYGPAVFVPAPGEWLHTFSWHASKGGSRGVAKEPN